MVICSEKDMEILKCIMIKHEQMFKDQVRELHRLYQIQTLLMSQFRKKDSNTSTLTSPTLSECPCQNHGESEFHQLEIENSDLTALSFPNASKHNGNQQHFLFGTSLFEKCLPRGSDVCETKQNKEIKGEVPTHHITDLDKPFDNRRHDKGVQCKVEETAKAKHLDNMKGLGHDVQLTLDFGHLKPANKEEDIQIGSCMRFGLPHSNGDNESMSRQPRSCVKAWNRNSSSVGSESVVEQTPTKCPILPNESFSVRHNLPKELRKDDTGWELDARTTFHRDRNNHSHVWNSNNNDRVSGAVLNQHHSSLVSPSCSFTNVASCHNFLTDQEPNFMCLREQAVENICKMAYGTSSHEGTLPGAIALPNHNHLQDHGYHSEWNFGSCSTKVATGRAAEVVFGGHYPNGSVLRNGQLEYPSFVSSRISIFGKEIYHSSNSEQQRPLHPLSFPTQNSLVSQQSTFQGNQSCQNFCDLPRTLSQGYKTRPENKLERTVDLALSLSSSTQNKVKADFPSILNLSDKMEDNIGQKYLVGCYAEGLGISSTEMPLLYEEKPRKHLNSLKFTELLEPFPENMNHKAGGNEECVPEDLSGSLRGLPQLKHEVARERKYVNCPTGMENYGNGPFPLDLVEKSIHDSSYFQEAPPTVHDRKGMYGRGISDLPDSHSEMKIPTFKKNIDIAYRSQTEWLAPDACKNIAFAEEKHLASLQQHFTDEEYFLQPGNKANRNHGFSNQTEGRGLKSKASNDDSQLAVCISKTHSTRSGLSEPHAKGSSVLSLDQQKHNSKKLSLVKTVLQTEGKQTGSTEAPPIFKSASECSSSDKEFAANALLMISSGKTFAREFSTSTSASEVLEWFADTTITNANCGGSTIKTQRKESEHLCLSSKGSQNAEEAVISTAASKGLDFFESMTLMIQETVTETINKAFPEQEEKCETRQLEHAPLRTSKRTKRQRDFLREILPGILSLSRQEIAEDFQIIEGLVRSTGNDWHAGPSRRNASKFCFTDEWFVPERTGRRTRKSTNGRKRRPRKCGEKMRQSVQGRPAFSITPI